MTPADVERIDCPVAAFIVPIVCEPAREKLAPASDSHGRVSLQYTPRRGASCAGALGKARVQRRQPARPGDPRRSPDACAITWIRRSRGRAASRARCGHAQGRPDVLTEVEEYNRGSAENPMTDAELRAKFDENASGFLSQAARDRVADAVAALDTLADARSLVDLAAVKA